MNVVTTFFKVFGFLVIIPVIFLLFPIAISYYLMNKGLLDFQPDIAVVGCLVFFAILNTAWILFLLQTAVNFGWIIG